MYLLYLIFYILNSVIIRQIVYTRANRGIYVIIVDSLGNS